MSHICDCGEHYSSSALVLACATSNHGRPRLHVVQVEATPELKQALTSAVSALKHDLPREVLFELQALELAVSCAARRA